MAKVAKRAKTESKRLAQEQQGLLKNIGELTTELKQQSAAHECESRHYRSTLSRSKQSKKQWERRAHAAEQSRRYMLAKARKHTSSRQSLLALMVLASEACRVG